MNIVSISKTASMTQSLSMMLLTCDKYTPNVIYYTCVFFFFSFLWHDVVHGVTVTLYDKRVMDKSRSLS